MLQDYKLALRILLKYPGLTISLAGLKFKVAHKRATSEKWSATPRTQRKRMIMFLQSVIADLEKQNAAEGDVVSAHEKPAAREQRKVRRAGSIVKRATRRRHRASRVSARARRPSLVRRAQRSRF